MISPHQLTTAEIDELIRILDEAMDPPSISTYDSFTEIGESSAQNKENEHGEFAIFLSEIWERFVEYCQQNELDPAQQVREAAASHYQDLLTTYRIRKRLTPSDNAHLRS